MYEARRGRSYALNEAVSKASGDIILLTDDDIRFPNNWIAKMCQPVQEGRAHAVAGSVKIASHLQRPWMTPLLRTYLCSTETMNRNAPTYMIGANMAFSRAVLSAVREFDTELGPGALGFCDDSLFAWRLLRKGYKIVAAMDSPVEHHFQTARLSRSSFLKRAKNQGRSEAYILHHWYHRGVRAAKLRPLAQKLILAAWRATHPSLALKLEGISQEEFRLVTMLHMFQQFLTESTRPRKYNAEGSSMNVPSE